MRGIDRAVFYLLYLFMFIDDLLRLLSNSEMGLRIGNYFFNNVAFADDITLLAAMTPDIQSLIDMCVEYSSKWRFEFGIAKTWCTTFGHADFVSNHNWTLGPAVIENSDTIDILGVRFRSDLKSVSHVEQRISSARRRAFSLLNAGFSYPGLSSDAKVYLWKSTICPILVYGNHTMAISNKDVMSLEIFQSNNLKRVLGFPKRSHHSKVLQAMGVEKVATNITKQRVFIA